MVTVAESFTALGARRGSNWQGTPSPAELAAIAATTRDGFTGHEMLDNLGLVHMRGRVYDPVIGRFLSVDPVVRDIGARSRGTAMGMSRDGWWSAADPTGFAMRWKCQGVTCTRRNAIDLNCCATSTSAGSFAGSCRLGVSLISRAAPSSAASEVVGPVVGPTNQSGRNKKCKKCNAPEDATSALVSVGGLLSEVEQLIEEVDPELALGRMGKGLGWGFSAWDVGTRDF